jgi:hypothetical protein
MPTVTFSLEDAFYRALEELSKRLGVSPHRVAKEIVVNYLLNLMLDAYVAHKAGNLMQSINMEHKYPDIYVEHKAQTYSSDISIANKAPTYSSDVNIGNKSGQDPISVDELVQRIADLLEKRLFRKIQDQLNASTSKAEQIAQKQAEIVERLEALEERVKKLEEATQRPAKASEESAKKGAKREKPDKCEILRKELAVFESEIYGKIRDRDRFFASLERDCGATVIECARERIAVEKNYWQSFTEKLSKIDTSDDDKIKKQLDSLELKLFKALKESALIIYDTNEKKWKPTIKPSTESSVTKRESSTSRHNEKHREYEDDSWLMQYAPQSPEET